VDTISIAGTDNAPRVEFDYNANTFTLAGMSFMEDVSGFYEPLMQPFREHMEGLSGAAVQFEFALSYFNSSSARVVFQLFELLDQAAGNGNQVAIRWCHDDDDDMVEQGEEFGEDLEHASFTVVDPDT